MTSPATNRRGEACQNRVRIETEDGAVADICLSDETLSSPATMDALKTLIDAANAHFKHHPTQYPAPDGRGDERKE